MNFSKRKLCKRDTSIVPMVYPCSLAIVHGWSMGHSVRGKNMKMFKPSFDVLDGRIKSLGGWYSDGTLKLV